MSSARSVARACAMNDASAMACAREGEGMDRVKMRRGGSK